MNPVETFIRNNYSDAQLAQLLDDCRAGTFRYASCDCLLGRTIQHTHESYEHLYVAREIPGAADAEQLLAVMMFDAKRMEFLIPICEAEISRRIAPVPESVTA